MGNFTIANVFIEKGEESFEHIIKVSSAIVPETISIHKLIPGKSDEYNFGKNFRDYVKQYIVKDEIIDEIKDIESHLKALNLGSIDLFFLKKIKKITLTELKYYDQPFAMIETTDQTTYLFSDSEPIGNYCVCSEDDNKYNNEHKCCGVNCDWEAPIITKIEPKGKVTKYVYQGEQNFLWD